MHIPPCAEMDMENEQLFADDGCPNLAKCALAYCIVDVLNCVELWTPRIRKMDLEFGGRVDLHGFPPLLAKGIADDDRKPNRSTDRLQRQAARRRLVNDPNDA